MLKLNNKEPFVYRLYYLCALVLLSLIGCGPKFNQSARSLPPAEEISYEGEAAVPTLVIPQATANDNIKYSLPPKKIINNDKIEIILGEAELKNTKISYNSSDRKMLITGQVRMRNETKEQSPVKSFSLAGTHEKNQNIFILKDELTANKKNKILVGAEANCLNSDGTNDLDCNHVMVDVYIFYKNKYYTEQIEMDRTKLKSTPPLTTPEAPPAAAEASPPQQPDEDQANDQQSEDSDNSIDGRYEGSVQTVDLDQLFPEIPPDVPSVPVSPPQKKKAKDLSPDLIQTKDGEVRPVNQALGFPDRGQLRNATSLLTRQQALDKKAFFEVAAPDRKKYYATYEMVEIISQIARQMNQKYNKILYVSNLSAIHGGKLSPHVSHQNGLDADLAYPTDRSNLKFPLVVNMKTREYFPKNYSLEETFNLFKFLFMQNEIRVDRIFVDQNIIKDLCNYALDKNEFSGINNEPVRKMFENLQHVAGHGDHFHLRIKCSQSDPGCRSRIYRKMENCSHKS